MRPLIRLDYYLSKLSQDTIYHLCTSTAVTILYRRCLLNIVREQLKTNNHNVDYHGPASKRRA